jgi:putative transposase
MDEYQSLSHTVWDCKYHVVWIPEYRRKGGLRCIRDALRKLVLHGNEYLGNVV